MNRLSLRSANLLFLITMVLVISAGSFIQTYNFSGGLIATEAILILLPTLLFLRFQKIPFAEGLRLKPIGPLTALVAVLLGGSAFLFSIFIEAFMAQITRMQPVPGASSALPVGLLDSVLYFIAMAIFAPLCEEVLFRGAIQRAYEGRRSVIAAISITALMFAFYHFRVSGLPALVPVAFILGYVAWRTRSIYASMLVHFGMNASSAAYSLISIHGGITGVAIVSQGVAVTGVALSIALLYALSRLNPLQRVTSTGKKPRVVAVEPEGPWLATFWPLAVAGVLYLVVAGITVWSSVSPQARASSDVEYFQEQFDKRIESVYQITDPGGGTVGEMTCVFQPVLANLNLKCIASVQGYEVKLPSSYFKDTAHTKIWSVTWEAQSMRLLSYSFQRLSEDGSNLSAHYGAGQLTFSGADGTDLLMLEEAKNVMLDYEWPWHADMLLTNAGDVWEIQYGKLREWDEQQKKSVTVVQKAYLQVYDDEQITLPAGTYMVRKFTLAGQSAWYARNDAGLPRPVQFYDGILTYSLMP